ncbi:response regulator [Pseudomonas costantinii]|uniref:DNA-binding response regulator n=1 Tax=Pseudomonas costantinii TaxID=168469 RepID=A0A1S2V137_9PSED|nr:response regulator [Pseudomonas costantinii]NVZ18335.1 response regulator [Pseudomonas costantinii]NVZ69900.1 response regulator [Pseudomonas costantinii]OIN51856.1 DNA-binding response regulator [Pseudomonas costantinii]SEE41692.1 two-component system, OmpR family, KDP operon response regulator KdpE [Pseudomonas costantinii]
MSTARILIVEDEANIRRFVGIALQDEGFQVFEADSVKRALIHAASRQPDLVIVDLGLPDGDGKQLISELRGWLAVPILVLSARDREEEKVAALDAGADDYLTKPFGVPELLARIRAQLRRHGQTGTVAATSKVVFGEIEVDLATHEVWRQTQPVHLTPIEYRLLCAMIRGQSRVLTHRQLLLEVWGLDYVDRPHYLRVHMAHLRQKLEADPAQPQHFITELQVGYRLMGL